MSALFRLFCFCILITVLVVSCIWLKCDDMAGWAGSGRIVVSPEQRRRGPGNTSSTIAYPEQRRRGPVTAVARRVWEKYPNKTWRGLQLPVLSVMPLGRLGNAMGEYATLYALGRIYNVTVRINPYLQRVLNATFPNLTIPLPPGKFNKRDWTAVGRTSKTNYGKAETAAAGLLGPGRFLLTGYPFEIQLFHHYKKELLRELTFAPAIQANVMKFLRQSVERWRVQNARNDTPVLIGIHVRRTDYKDLVQTFGGSLPGVQYFNRALQYYTDKFRNVLFIVASDDRKYVKETFKGKSDVILSPGKPRELDMAVLAACDHSIITLGSFGFWCGYLAGGEVLYPNGSYSRFFSFGYEGYSLAGLDNFTPLPLT